MCVFVCVGVSHCAWAVCDYVCLPIYVFLWKRYRKWSGENSHQSLTQKEMERVIEDGKKDGGHHRKQHLEKRRGGDRVKVDEWMEQSVQALIELGSVVYIL